MDVAGLDKERQLKLSVDISNAVTSVVAELGIQPAFIVAKGGITSSDIGVRALRVRQGTGEGSDRPRRARLAHRRGKQVPLHALRHLPRQRGRPDHAFAGGQAPCAGNETGSAGKWNRHGDGRLYNRSSPSVYFCRFSSL